MKKLPVGLYDLLHTAQLQRRLEHSGLLDHAVWAKIEPEDLKARLAIPLAREIAGFIGEAVSGKKEDALTGILSELLQSPETLGAIIEALKPFAIDALQQIKPEAPLVASTIRPDTPLSVSALLTGSSRSPALRSQLIKELATCDRADWLVSFIKFAGILPLLPTLREFTQTQAQDGGPRLRIATTSYMGATDLKAIEMLQKLPNTEIRISYDTKRTRLHAKAYLFHRTTGFGSAYIGSANVSKAALDEGLEWTAKISQYETDHLWQHAVASFESHWENANEFTRCGPEDLPVLANALAAERGSASSADGITFFDLRPYTFQQAILDDISAERHVGKNQHLIIAATGTGKTMIAAFDYHRFAAENIGKARLLFVAHREEILRQARAAFRQVLRDGSFADIVAGSAQLSQTDHLFCTVQSWNSQEFSRFSAEHFDYVVLDEAHHASAESYQRLIRHIRPRSLLGLTATPERSDGEDIRSDFGGTFTHEIRLSEAIERALLSPFHYYGVPDLEGLDFSGIEWKRGGYDHNQLCARLESNDARARWVMIQTERHVADLSMVRGLGFCVSVAHAQFMAKFCNENGIPAISLSGESSRDLRLSAQSQLINRQIRFIFTVDLYNEGVDIPCVDTVLFLRPTESLTLFLQQLGRGLRLYDEKPHLTVLDFIAPQNRRFSFSRRFKALTSRPELRIDRQIELDMPFVPAGCFLHLEKQAKEHVLNNIRNAVSNMHGQIFLHELCQLKRNLAGIVTIDQILDCFNLDAPDEIYKKGLPHQLLALADGITPENDLLGFDDQLANGFRRFAMMDDTAFLEDARNLMETNMSCCLLTKSFMHSALWGKKKPENGTLEQVHAFFMSRQGLLRDLRELIVWLLQHRTPLQRLRFAELTGSLNLHASYTRDQILLGLGQGCFEQPRSSREGVLHVPDRKVDAFFADINKSEADFSPTTMYEDYAITDRLFHWQSQSQTTDTTGVGKRYIQHAELGYTPMLFIRDRKKLANGLTSPYFFAGPLKYRKHEGSKPVSFIWELEHPLPARVMPWAGRVG